MFSECTCAGPMVRARSVSWVAPRSAAPRPGAHVKLLGRVASLICMVRLPETHFPCSTAIATALHMHRPRTPPNPSTLGVAAAGNGGLGLCALRLMQVKCVNIYAFSVTRTRIINPDTWHPFFARARPLRRSWNGYGGQCQLFI